MPSWGIELEVHSLQVQLQITDFLLRPQRGRGKWSKLTPSIQIGPTYDLEYRGLTELYTRIGLNGASLPQSVYGLSIGTLLFGEHHQHEILISFDHASYRRIGGPPIRYLVPEFIMKKPFGVGPESLTVPVTHTVDYLARLHDLLNEIKEMSLPFFSAVFTLVPGSEGQAQQILKLRGTALIGLTSLPAPHPPRPLVYSQITTAIDLSWFFSTQSGRPDPVQDLYNFGQSLNRDYLGTEVQYEFGLLQKTRRIMVLALEEASKGTDHIRVPGFEWIAGGIGMAVFTSLVLVFGIMNPRTSSAKNLWGLMPKSSILGVLRSVHNANITVYAALVNVVTVLLIENFRIENRISARIETAKIRLQNDGWKEAEFTEKFTPLLPVIALLHAPLIFGQVHAESLAQLDCDLHYFHHFIELARKYCDDTKKTTPQPGLGRPMFELRTQVLGSRPPLLHADSAILIDICNRLTIPSVPIPRLSEADSDSRSERTVDTIRTCPPTSEMWVPGMREMGHRMLERSGCSSTVGTNPKRPRH